MKIQRTIVAMFTAADANRAYEQWGCNCGPSALAAACGISLDDARAALPLFDARRYTNPSMMLAALETLVGRNRISEYSASMASRWPVFGLARIQWEGPWTEPGVPLVARYRQTHWVAAQKHPTKDEIAIFDVNAIGSVPGGVITLESWSQMLVPWILQECVPSANGRWHVTHSIEVRR